jgi:uncharacterized protein (TIGR00299 family) protein
LRKPSNRDKLHDFHMGERVLYLDCHAGAAGDMLNAALLDLGVPFKALSAELDKLNVKGFRVVRSKAVRGGIRGTRFRVDAPGDRGHRHWADFERVIKRSKLTKPVKDRSLALIRRVFEAEARVHGKKVESIHLHELGSLDTLVDVVGAVSCLEILGVDRVESSSINVGSGSVDTEHGRMPIPAPATALLLKGVPVFADGDFERTTPTGALLVTGFADRFGPWPAMTVKKIGYGLGTKDPKGGRPNALRAVLGETSSRGSDTVVVLETTVDDATPEQLGFLQERLWEAGALDVFLTPVFMKKNRPGTNVTVLVSPGQRDTATEVLFHESPTFGVRAHPVERDVLERRHVTVSTPYGKVRVKEGSRGGDVVRAAPEYEDCKRLARAKKVTLQTVQRAAIAAYEDLA